MIKALAFVMWLKPQNCQNIMIFYGVRLGVPHYIHEEMRSRVHVASHVTVPWIPTTLLQSVSVPPCLLSFAANRSLLIPLYGKPVIWASSPLRCNSYQVRYGRDLAPWSSKNFTSIWRPSDPNPTAKESAE